MKSLFYFLPLFLLYLTNPLALQASDDCKTPSGMKVEELSGGDVKLSWDAVKDAKGYKLEVEDAYDNPHDFEVETTVSQNYYVVTGLKSNSSYKFKLRTICKDDKSDWTDDFYFITQAASSSGNNSGDNNSGSNNGSACDTPTGLTVSDISGNSATISWNAVDAAVNYEVEVEDGDNTPAFYFNQITNTTSVSISGLAAGGQYKAKVKSKCSNDNSDYTQWVFFIAGKTDGSTAGNNSGSNNGSTCDTPTGLTVSDISGNSATISWNAVGAAVNYEVEVEDGDNTPAFYFNQITNTTSVSISGLAAGGQYKAKVKSKCSNDNSDYTQWVFFIAGRGPVGSDSTAVDTTGNASCAAPAGLIVSAITDSSAIVSWAQPEGISLFEVEAEEANDSTPDYVFKLLTNQSDISLIGLKKGGTYKVKVKSKCGEDSSAYTEWVFFTTGGQPTSGDTTVVDTTGAFCAIPMNLQVSEIGPDSVRISWDAVPGVSNYELEVEDDENTPAFEFNTITGETSVIVRGLSPKGQYQAKVKSKCSDGFESEYSDWIFFTTLSNELKEAKNEQQENSLLNQVSAISLFPNPASQELRIELPENNDLLRISIRIFDQRGQVVWNEENLPSEVFPRTVPVSRLKNGMYHVSVLTRLGVKTSKLMIAH